MKSKDVLAFTLGATIGTLIGVLLAPSSGRTTMDKLVSVLKKQPVVNDFDNVELYKLSEITEKGVEELQKLKAEAES